MQTRQNLYAQRGFWYGKCRWLCKMCMGRHERLQDCIVWLPEHHEISTNWKSPQSRRKRSIRKFVACSKYFWRHVSKHSMVIQLTDRFIYEYIFHALAIFFIEMLESNHRETSSLQRSMSAYLLTESTWINHGVFWAAAMIDEDMGRISVFYILARAKNVVGLGAKNYCSCQ